MSTINGLRIYRTNVDYYNDVTIIESINNLLGKFPDDKIKKSGWKELNGKKFFSFWWMEYENHGIIEADSWFNFLQVMGLDEEFQTISEDYKKINKGLLTIFKFSNYYYITSFGDGFRYIPKELDSRFGIELAKKMIGADGKIRSLYQKELGGGNKQLESISRSIRIDGNYDPKIDFDNTTRVVNFLSGKVDVLKVFYETPSQFTEEIEGVTKVKFRFLVEGKESVYFSLKSIDRAMFLELLNKVDSLYNNNFAEHIKIPELILKNDKNFELEIYSFIQQNFSSLFFDERNLYFSYSILKDSLKLKGVNHNDIKQIEIYNTSNQDKIIISEGDLLEELSHSANCDNVLNVSNDFREMHIKFEFSTNRNSVTFPFSHFIQGEVNYLDEVYFLLSGKIYLPNDDFYSCVNMKLEQIIDGKELLTQSGYLYGWEKVKNDMVSTGKLHIYQSSGGNPRTYWEGMFNANHGINIDDSKKCMPDKEGLYCLDKGVHDGIEICDIIDIKNRNLIHVKRGNGAKIREVFSQGKVSILSIKDNNEVDKILDLINAILPNNIQKRTLQKGYSVVFAICPKTPKSIYSRQDYIDYFDSYKNMKYEITSTFQYLESQGIDCKLYFITL